LQQFGGGAGGAIKKDKLFWFAAAERQVSKLPRQVFFGSIYGLTPTTQTQEAISFYQSWRGMVCFQDGDCFCMPGMVNLLLGKEVSYV